jgi:uncharacterized protein (TIGR00297 family)
MDQHLPPDAPVASLTEFADIPRHAATLSAWGSVAGPSAPVAIGLATVIAATAWSKGSLRPSGAIAAAVVGSIALHAGWSWGGFLIVWFAWVTLGTRLGRARKEARTAGIVAKGGQRDATQVMANGGIFAAAATLSLLRGDLAAHAAVWGAAALAAAGADTMATEIGTWIGGAPRSVRTGRPVPTGTSGAVSLAGSVSMVGSALGLTAVAVAIGLVSAPHWWIVAVAGVFGAVVDTVAGALLQQRRWCPSCETPTEQMRHSCGMSTRHRGGWRWLGNDEVNLLCTASAAVLAWRLASMLA